jgi:hypothetical protein
MSDENRNLFPSKAFIDARGQYVHDPLNQHYAEQEKQGKLAPQDRGQQEHISKISGYCSHLVLGGCPLD